MPRHSNFNFGRTRLLILALEVPLLALLIVSVLGTRPGETGERFSKALGNTHSLRQRAHTQSLSLNDDDLRDAAANYRLVLSKNPMDAAAWDGLAKVESKLGDENAHSAVLRGWIQAIPHSPRASWALANLLVRQGKTQESLPYFRRAAADEASLREPVFELSGKLLDDPQQILTELVPDDAASLQQYFFFLIDRKNLLAEAEPVWRKVLQRQGEMAIPVGIQYVERLAAAGLGTEAERVWTEISPESNASQLENRERIQNGDFEKSLRNGGLEWQLTPAAGYKFSLDDFQAHSGSRSLRLSFDGTTNPEFSALRQWVIVEPDTDYDFTAAIKTQNLTTNNGIFFSLLDFRSAAGTTNQTSPQSGSVPWTEERLQIHTGPQTRVLLLSVRRQLSTKLDNLLRGEVWIDAISLRPSK